jgi:hypothetical protein
LTIEAIQFDNSELRLHTRLVEGHSRSRPADLQTISPANSAGVPHAAIAQPAVNGIKQQRQVKNDDQDEDNDNELAEVSGRHESPEHHNEAKY